MSEPLSIRQLDVFVALIERGSFTKAARHLGLSQSTVSGHVADLERRLGVRLVERDRSGVRTTAAGEALLRPAREVLRAEHGARQAVEELAGLLRGTLRIGGSTIPSCYLLPPLLARFHALHPGVALQLVTGDSRAVAASVRAAEVEIGVVGAPPEGADLEAEPFGEDRLLLVCRPDHPLAARKTVTLKDLAGEPLVMREPGSGTRRSAEAALAPLLPEPGATPGRIACEVGSTEAAKGAVRAGLGMAFLSSLAVAEDLERGLLAKVRLAGFDVRRRFFVLSRRTPLPSPAAAAFAAVALGRQT